MLHRLKFKYRNPYQTRHTFATLLLAAGESPEWIAQQMGHSTITMLFRVYSRYIPNLTRQDGSAFDRYCETQGEAGLSELQPQRVTLTKTLLKSTYEVAQVICQNF